MQAGRESLMARQDKVVMDDPANRLQELWSPEVVDALGLAGVPIQSNEKVWCLELFRCVCHFLDE